MLHFWRNILALLVLIIIMVASCQTPEKPIAPPTTGYLNHADSARYVGINTCLQCHPDKKSFLETGMGKSFDLASKTKSSGSFSLTSLVYDRYSHLTYFPHWNNDQLWVKEYEMEKGDTIHQLNLPINYIIGSGQHTNSHMVNQNGYIYQAPFTFYTQKGIWDLPPGFENGHNTRFSREIGLECMSCHNGYPDFVLGSENKYNLVKTGIDCERCHGPGSMHVAQFQNGIRVDTATKIDYSIVNPAKLPIERQFDVCMRCHLQGNTVLAKGKSFLDFKPGQKLSDYMTVFLPNYVNNEENFIMASHADRLKQSKCFIASAKKTENSKNLKPYKDALTCVTCHNPHVSVKQTGNQHFNQVCKNCHSNYQHPATSKLTKQSESNCVNCHMPQSGSIDIPHVSIHDHYIRKPVSKKEKDQLKTYLNIRSVNNKKPTDEITAEAYLNQFEKFDGKTFLLDSAMKLIERNGGIASSTNLHNTIRYYFLKENYSELITIVEQINPNRVLMLAKQKSYDNKDAWTLYRIAEAYTKLNQPEKSLPFIEQCCQLAPFVLKFQDKKATLYYFNNRLEEALKVYEFIIKENPKYAAAYNGAGFLYLQKGDASTAKKYYFQAHKLDPHNELILMNIAGLYTYLADYKTASNWFKKVLKYYPDNLKAKEMLSKLKSLS